MECDLECLAGNMSSVIRLLVLHWKSKESKRKQIKKVNKRRERKKDVAVDPAILTRLVAVTDHLEPPLCMGPNPIPHPVPSISANDPILLLLYIHN